ncbi:MAG TPA: cupredoxin domain-containing protein [Anaerolineales bacterium]|nr:cupredoxin domain-containing protein [Anaerolineales bacterium]
MLSLLALAAAFLAACSGSSASSQPLEIMLQASGMTYQPATIEVTAGQPVKLTFQNTDALEHDFSIMEIPMASMGATAEPMAGHDMENMATDPQLHMAVAMNATNTMEFTPTKPGTYEFFCTVAGHKEAGMKGTLIVKQP